MMGTFLSDIAAIVPQVRAERKSLPPVLQINGCLQKSAARVAERRISVTSKLALLDV
jgi:hypothetical protein